MTLRTVVVLLVLANVALFGYARLDRASQSEAGRLAEQVRPESIRILTSQQVAALGPAKVAALPDVCVEWGPLSDADRARAQADIEPLQLGRLLTQRQVATDTTWWVNTGPMATRALADRRAAELRALAIDDLQVVDYGRGQFTVSLGVFRTESAASARSEALLARGIGGTRVESRPGTTMQSIFVVRDPPQAAVARLKELQMQYAGSDLKVGPCTAS
jgi:hypothetical protein